MRCNQVRSPATTYSIILAAGSPVAITGVSSQISGVTGTPAVSFNAQSVSLSLTGTTWHPGDGIVVTLTTACTPCSLDIDGNGAIDALTDGMRRVSAPPRQVWLASLGTTALAVRSVRAAWDRLVEEGATAEGWLRHQLGRDTN